MTTIAFIPFRQRILANCGLVTIRPRATLLPDSDLRGRSGETAIPAAAEECGHASHHGTCPCCQRRQLRRWKDQVRLCEQLAAAR